MFHGCFLIEVDDTCGAFALRSCHHLLHNLFDGCGVAFHGSRQGPATKGTEANHAHVNLRNKFFRQTVVIGHDEVAVNLYARTFLCEIERHDRDVLESDVLPNVKFRPVAEREYANAFSLVYATVVNVPKLWALVLRVPLIELVTETEDAFLCPRLLFITTSSAEGCIELPFVQGIEQGFCLHQVGMHFAAMREGSHACLERLHVALYNQVPTMFFCIRVAELNHLAELPFRVDVHQWERHFAWRESLFSKAYHHAAVLADAIEHDGILEFCCHLSDDVDGLCFEFLKVAQTIFFHLLSICFCLLVQLLLPPLLSTSFYWYRD